MPTSPSSSTLIIGPSLVRLLSTMGLGALGMSVGAAMLIVALWGMPVLVAKGWLVVAVVAALGIGNLAIALVRHRPRLEIDAEGFSVLPIFGGHSRRWTDIDGDFAVIKAGLYPAVAYRLTPAYKQELGFKPTTLFQGYDCAITGAFALPIPELATVLNEWKARVSLGSNEVSPRM